MNMLDRMPGGYAWLQAGCLLVCAGLLGGCDAREKVVVYSPHGSEMLGDYERLFEAAYPEVDLQWLDMGAQEVYSRVGAERNRPAGDVWWGGPASMFEQAAAESLLEAYRPDWAEQVEPELRDPEGRWFPTHLSPIVILYNTTRLSAEEVPQTWDALLLPEWRGRIALRRPLASGTMRTFLAAMILRAPTEDAGFDWLRKLHENTATYPESPNLLFDHLKRNPERISVWLLPDIVMQRDRNGFPFGFHVPAEAPVLTEGIAIVRNAPHLAWARLFYEFVTSQQSLVQQAEAYAKMPARTDIAPARLPDWMTAQQVDALEMDWDRLRERENAWMARWEREVYTPK